MLHPQNRAKKLGRRFRPMLSTLETRVVPAISTWDGGGANANWTNSANWVGDVAPIPNDDLVFPAITQRLSTVNDFSPGTTFHSILVTVLSYSLTGNVLSLSSDFTADLPDATIDDPGVLVLLPFKLNGQPLTIDVINAQGQPIIFSEPITGSGGIVKIGGGTVILGNANTYTGPTQVTSGILSISTDSALGAIGPGNETSIASGATLELAAINLNSAESISFSGRGVDRNIEGHLVSGGAIFQRTGSNSLTGPLTLTGDALISGPFGNQNSLTITSGIGEIGGSHKLDIGQAGLVGCRLVFASTAINTFTGGATTYFNLQYDGHGIEAVTVANGFFVGKGMIGPLTSLSSSGPGSNPEVRPTVGGIKTGDLHLGGRTTIDIELQDLGPFVTQGTVTLSGQLFVSLGTFGPDFEVQPGMSYRIIDNDGTDPVVGTFLNLPEGAIIPGASQPVPLTISYHGGDGNDVVLFGASKTALATGAGEGGAPVVNVFDVGGNLIRSFLAYPAGFRGGVHVATADVNSDLVPDIITGAGPGGGPLVRVWDGATFTVIREFYAYDPNFTGGVFVAAANTIPEGFPGLQPQHADIITGAGPGGGPHVKVFNGADGSLYSSFFAYDPSFHGGVNVAATQAFQVSKSVFPGDVITGAGPGGGPHVRVFEAVNGHLVSEFFAYDPNFRGGVSVAYNPDPNRDLDNASIITAPMTNGVPVIQLFSFFGELKANFIAYDPSFQGGINLAVLPLGNNGRYVLVTGAGPTGGPHVREWTWDNGPVLVRQFMAFDPAFTGGVFVG